VDQKLFYIAVTVAVYKDGRFLIIQRSEKEKFLPGVWIIPGGKITTADFTSRPPDSPIGKQWYNITEQVVEREAEEEVNIAIKNIRYLTNTVDIRPDGNPGFTIILLADWESGEVKIDPEEVADFAWVNLDEAKSYGLFEGVYEVLEMAYRVINGKDKGLLKLNS